jgi:hypothetical protein
MPALATAFPQETRLNTATTNRRNAERFRLGTALVFVVVGAHGNTPETKGHFEGHAYDLSDSGIRVELDAALPVGTPVDVSVHFPGCGSPLHLVGKVARLFDEIDDPGPRRMGLHAHAATKADEARLQRLLDQAAFGQLI